MITYICDRCGAAIEAVRPYRFTVSEWSKAGWRNVLLCRRGGTRDNYDYDLCDGCMRDLTEWIRGQSDGEA